MSFREILESFQSIGVHLESDWLAGVEVIQEGPLTNDFVYQALALSDLRKSCIIPPQHALRRIASSGFSRFPEGSFLFQATRVDDISIPDALRPRMDSSTKRFCRLSLHIGDIAVIAIENESLRVIPDVPDAGLKLIISGAPDVVDGIVFLDSDNVQIVGGDVHELVRAQTSEAEKRLRSRDPLETISNHVLHEIQNR